MIIRFYGASDDLVEIEGDAPMLNGMDKGASRAEWGFSGGGTGGPDEFHIMGPAAKCEECGHTGPDEHIATVFVLYDGQWIFAAAMGKEDKDGKYRWPANWTATLAQREDSTYSMELIIDTGKDKVGILKPDYEEDED